MKSAEILTLVCIILGGGLAISLFFMRRLLYSAYILLAILLIIAVLFFLSEASFLGVAQILVYNGGILVMIMFGVMLTRGRGLKVNRAPYTISWLAVLASLGLGTLLFLMLDQAFSSSSSVQSPFNGSEYTPVQNIGKELLTQYLLPFEWASLVLLLALIGGSYMARKTKLKHKEQH